MTLHNEEQKETSYQHAYTVQDIFITDCYFKIPFANLILVIQQRPMRRKVLSE
jgi:hypothetical protein